MNKGLRAGIIAAIVLLAAAMVCLFAMQMSLDGAVQTETELQQQLADGAQRIAELEGQAAQLEQQLAEKQEALETAQTQAAADQAEIARLSDEYAALEAQFAAAQQEVAGLNAARELLTEQLRTANEQLAAVPTATPEVTAAPVPEATAAPAAEAQSAAEYEALLAQLADLTAQNEALSAQNAALTAALAQNEPENAPQSAALTVRDGAAKLGLVNPAQAGQRLQVRLYAGDEMIGEAESDEPGAVIGEMPVTAEVAAGTEVVLEYAVLDAQGGVVYRVRIPMQTEE